MQTASALGAFFRSDDLQRFEHHQCLHGRHGIREGVRPATKADRQLQAGLIAGHEAAIGCKGFGEGAQHDIDLAQHALLLHGAQAFRPHAAQVVRHVHQQGGLVAVRQFLVHLQVGHVGVHGKE